MKLQPWNVDNFSSHIQENGEISPRSPDLYSANRAREFSLFLLVLAAMHQSPFQVRQSSPQRNSENHRLRIVCISCDTSSAALIPLHTRRVSSPRNSGNSAPGFSLCLFLTFFAFYGATKIPKTCAARLASWRSRTLNIIAISSPARTRYSLSLPAELYSLASLTPLPSQGFCASSPERKPSRAIASAENPHRVAKFFFRDSVKC